MHPTEVDTPEKLFGKAQAYYNQLLVKPNGWIRTTKQRAAFLASLPEMLDIPTQSYADVATSGAAKPDPKEDAKKPETDRAGNVIDRKPPKDGVKTRTNNGKEEHWCGKCPKGGRWGNHSSEGHDKWVSEFKERRKAWENKKKKADDNAESSSTTGAANNADPPSMSRRATVATPILSMFQPGGYDSDASF